MVTSGGIFDRFPPMSQPVRDVDGLVRHRVVVPQGEMICLVCGETTADSYCLRCSDREQGIFVRKLIPTVNYLKENEYVIT
jgi:hypothetical protein